MKINILATHTTSAEFALKCNIQRSVKYGRIPGTEANPDLHGRDISFGRRFIAKNCVQINGRGQENRLNNYYKEKQIPN